MKIVHVLLTSRFAGSERYMIELANAQSERHEVTVVLCRAAAEDRPNALAHRLVPAVRRVYVSNFRLLALWQVRQALGDLSADVVHAHLSLACRSLRGLDIPSLRIATLHIRFKPQQHAELDALIAIAPWQLAALPLAQRERTQQIDNWTVLRPFDAEARARLRASLGLRNGDFLVGAMGRVEPTKGLDLLLNAFLALQSANARLAIVGAGRDWQALRDKAPAEVVMPGFVAQPHEWFAAFDAFVSPARTEPFGLVMLEAMASGLPVLACATEGARHLAGLIERPLVPCDDGPALQATLQQLLAQRPPRRSYDMEAFRLEARVAEIEGWYNACIGRRRAA